MTPEEKRAANLAEIDAMSEKIKQETASKRVQEEHAAAAKAGKDLANGFWTVVFAIIIFVIISRNETAIFAALNAFVEWAKHG